MPAGLPGDTLFNNQGNPNAGAFVLMDPLSGPKDTAFDAKTINYATGTPPGWDATTKVPIKTNDDSNVSTGGLSTGIGFGSQGAASVRSVGSLIAGNAMNGRNFTDDYIPGQSKPDAALGTDSTYMYIGGGRSNIVNGTGPGLNGYPVGWYHSEPVPYDETEVGLCGAGNGGSRDSGANSGFPIKMVTATGAAANGAAVEAGWTNRSGVALVTGQSVFGSKTTPLATPA